MHKTNQLLKIGNKEFNSRLLIGTGKYSSLEVMQKSIVNTKCEIVTVAVRRIQGLENGHKGLMESIDWQSIWMLPNTAGCTNAEEAIRVARMGRELAKLSGQENNNFVKLEVIPNKKYLLPDPIGTLKAAEKLVKEGEETTLTVVIEFPNKDKALGWYNSDEHQKIVVQRRKATDPKSTIVICEESDSY